MMDIDVQHIEYHRNGVSGEGFFSVVFHWEDNNGQNRNMVGIVFDYDDHPGRDNTFFNCRTAVLDRDYLVPTGESEGPFGGGSTGGIPCFRGDHFDSDLRLSIREALIEHDIRSGIYTRDEAVAAQDRRIKEAQA